jgi:hypothetical protein
MISSSGALSIHISCPDTLAWKKVLEKGRVFENASEVIGACCW